MSRLRAYFLLFAFLPATFGNVPVVQANDVKKVTSEFNDFYKSNRSLHGVILALKDHVSPDTYKFLKGKVDDLDPKAYPKVTTHGKNGLLIEYGSLMVPFKVVDLSSGEFLFNNKKLVVSQKMTPEEIWGELEKRLPRKSASVLDFLFPTAHAAEPVSLVLGTVAVLAVGSAVVGWGISKWKCRRMKPLYEQCESAKTHIASERSNDPEYWDLQFVQNLEEGLYQDIGIFYSFSKTNFPQRCRGENSEGKKVNFSNDLWQCFSDLEDLIKEKITDNEVEVRFLRRLRDVRVGGGGSSAPASGGSRN